MGIIPEAPLVRAARDVVNAERAALAAAQALGEARERLTAFVSREHAASPSPEPQKRTKIVFKKPTKPRFKGRQAKATATARARILAFMADKIVHTTPAIRNVAKVSGSTVYATLAELCKEKRITKVGRGRYKIVKR